MAGKTHGTRQKPMHRGPSGSRPVPPSQAPVPRHHRGGRSKFPSPPGRGARGEGAEEAEPTPPPPPAKEEAPED